MEIKGTPLEANPDHVLGVRDERRWIDSDLFRLVILHNYGGVYFDADVLLLRDLAPIMAREWLYQWGSSCNFSNGAVANMHKKSELSKRLLTQVRSKGCEGRSDEGLQILRLQTVAFSAHR